MKFFYLTVVGYPAAPRMNDTKGHQLYVIVLCQASDKLSSGFGKNTWGRLAIGKCEWEKEIQEKRDSMSLEWEGANWQFLALPISDRFLIPFPGYTLTKHLSLPLNGD